MFHACDTISGDDPPHETQIVWDYFTGEPHGENATSVAARFLAELEERVVDDGVRGRDELIDGITRGGVTFAQARQALTALLGNRPVMIVMDNLEDLHVQLDDLENVLAGLFHAVGKLARGGPTRPFDLQVCLPSELWDEIHRISANPEKDFGGNYLTIYWTADELLRLAGRRYRLFMQLHHPGQLEKIDPGGHSDVALLRAALPKTVTGGQNIENRPEPPDNTDHKPDDLYRRRHVAASEQVDPHQDHGDRMQKDRDQDFEEELHPEVFFPASLCRLRCF